MKKIIFLIGLLFVFIQNGQTQSFEGNILYKVIFTDTIIYEGCIFRRHNTPVFWNLWFKDSYMFDEMQRNKELNEESSYKLTDFGKNIYLLQGLGIKGLKKREIYDDCEMDNIEIIKTSEFDYIYEKKCVKYLLKNKTTKQICEVWALQNQNIILPKRMKMSFFRGINAFCFTEQIGFPMKVKMREDETEYVNTHITLEVIKIENQKLELSFFEKYKKLLKPSIDLTEQD